MNLQMIRMRVATILVIGDDHVWPESTQHSDEASHNLVVILKSKAAFGQRRQRVAGGQP